jgi:hypothetical protein
MGDDRNALTRNRQFWLASVSKLATQVRPTVSQVAPNRISAYQHVASGWFWPLAAIQFGQLKSF